ncbi:hypothetical protein CLAFUW4_03714 [Fulvia fulva]|uniref:Uncharacterized protein n=1 Tax=Passalora fulva TaxID=5499 RepID=A0A9Q8LBT5_PASFU|nr:uncharacterized protein CLAFUR5_03689 [Fulvia fulva]KAK4631368.1 hypothetical protein CLAFUR4_03702 [Fulvia fulva]UJO14601.1 hypothetical protein CLAFUR5_03689 [Fulvia fulva]WPV11673.1 hypothetical protein CLAFUW4_03714 [Fulvia fulva]WPV25482.1 hypothetical protein CLAFUW7_03706 [Fulvia fulva]
MATVDHFFRAPRELRDRFYKNALKGVTVVHVKHNFVRNQHSKPFAHQWLVPVIPANSPLVQIAGANRQANAEVYEYVKRRALKYNHIKIIARVLDFDFRALIKFLESLTPADVTKINNATQPKLIVLLNVTDSNAIDGKKLGAWFRFRKTASVTLTYSVGTDPGFNASLRQLYTISLAFGGNEEMNKIYKACVEWEVGPRAVGRQVKRWYEPPARDVEEDSEDELEESEVLRGSRGAAKTSKDVERKTESKKVNPSQGSADAARKSTGLLGLISGFAAGYGGEDEGEGEESDVEEEEDEEEEESSESDVDSDMMSDSDDDE